MAKRTKEQLAKKLQAWIKKHGGPTASLSSIHPNPDNPRTITEDALHKLCCQLADMPQTLQARCIVYDEQGIILGGNMRYAALGELGIAEVPENWLCCLEGLTEAQKEQFILVDNTGAGQWNWDILANEWNSDVIAEWGPVVPGWDVSGLAGRDDTDYSDKNKEIDTDSFDGKMIIKLEYTEDDYFKVRDQLAEIAHTPEQAVWKLLGNE